MKNFRLMAMTAIVLCCLTHHAKAQLWRYANYDPKADEKFEKELDSRATKVENKKTIAYGDTFSYKILTFRIRSFDGHPADIRFWEKPFSDRVFHIETGTEHWGISDFYALNDIRVISKDLLEFDYSPRGGSDQGFDHILLLGVDKGKLHIIADFQTRNEYAGDGKEGLWLITTKLNGNAVTNYQLSASLRDLCQSDKPGKSFDRKSKYLLKFDTAHKVFYTAFIPLNIKAKLITDYSGRYQHRNLKGTYPAINIDTEQYVYVDGTWFNFYHDEKSGYELSAYTAHPIIGKRKRR